MYRILLVDDEEIERLGIKKIITEEMGKDSIMIEEAENGRMAIMKAAEFRPNIVFMDIKMPGIDGIEATEEIKKLDNTVKVIMVTAFEAFEYARQAVKLGVKDYLLKPCSNQEIIDVLDNIISDIASEKQNRNHQINLKDNYKRALSIIQSREITSLIVGSGDFGMTTDNEDNWLGVYERPSYVMVLEFASGKIVNDDKQKIMDFIANQLRMTVTQSFVSIIDLDQVPILIQVERHDKEKESTMSQAVRIAQFLIEKIQQQLAFIPVKIGIGTCYDEIENFVQSYHEALFALAKTNRPYSYTYYNHLLSDNESIDYLFDLERQLLKHIILGQLEESAIAFKKYFDELIGSTGGSLDKIKEKLNEFFVLLNRQLYEEKVEVVFHQKYFQATSIYHLQELVNDQMMRITKTIQSLHFSDSKDMISLAKGYIQQHYEKSLTLEEVAEVVQFSPHYFSKLFKERCGKSFIDYVTEVRVERAKELMEKGKSVKEICFHVGYKDPNYFSRVFRRNTGFSPTEYRSKQLQNMS